MRSTNRCVAKKKTNRNNPESVVKIKIKKRIGDFFF
jgi:hypothetical protein